ncbi:MAG: ATP-binding protein [bacterium]|jgi:predicted kinase|nr:ATP-binding protein [bacterium]
MEKRPRLILVGGALATGKSTLSSFLSKKIGYQRVSLDEIKETLFDIAGYSDRAWSKEVGRLTFPVFRDLIGMHLSRGSSLIAEATFLWPSDVDWLEGFVREHDVELIQIWMTADPHVLRERFVSRATSGARHPGHNDDLEHVIEEFDDRFFNKSFIPLPLSGKTKIIDTTSFDDIDYDELLEWLQD